MTKRKDELGRVHGEAEGRCSRSLSKRLPLTNMVALVRSLSEHGAELYCLEHRRGRLCEERSRGGWLGRLFHSRIRNRMFVPERRFFESTRKANTSRCTRCTYLHRRRGLPKPAIDKGTFALTGLPAGCASTIRIRRIPPCFLPDGSSDCLRLGISRSSSARTRDRRGPRKHRYLRRPSPA